MKGITLWQPWASLIAIGAKTIETRSWGTRYRGPLLIHAAKKWDDEARDACAHAAMILSKYRRPDGEDPVGRLPWAETLGRILCVATLIDCRPMSEPPDDPLEAAFGWFGPGRFGWVLDDVAPLGPPVPMKGMQGLWDLPEKYEGRVMGALPERYARGAESS